MSFESRRGRQYYYQVRRVAGRLVKTYVGAGMEAEQAAADIAQRQVERAERKRRQQEVANQLLVLRSDFETFWLTSERILQMAFKAANFHCRKGEWRRHRDSHNSPG